MNIPRLAIKHPISTVMIMLVMILLGGVALINTPVDLLPQISPPILGIITTYPGASPQDVDNLITRPIESAVASVSGVVGLNSISSEHISIVVAEFDWGYNLNEARNDLDQTLSFLSLPDGSANPTVIKFDPTLMPMMQLNIANVEMDLTELSRYVKKELIPAIYSVQGVASVELTGVSEPEVEVLLKPEALAEYGLSVSQMAGIIQASNLTIPAGTVRDGDKELSLRVVSSLDGLSSLENLAITAISSQSLSDIADNLPQGFDLKALPPGFIDNFLSRYIQEVRLKDIASVELQNAKKTVISRINGQEALGLTIQKEGTANTVTVTKKINQKLEQLKKDNPSLEIYSVFSQGEFIQIAIDSVAQNLLVGAFLSCFILYLFLRRVRPMLAIAISIPFCVIVTFVLIYFRNLTINIMTLGGLALGIGMLVDNSIVVIENIYRRLEQYKESPAEAAEKGTLEVVNAIAASTLTTVAVFLPIVFIGGITGEVFKELALTVAFALFASLVVAITVVPMLASKWLKPEQINNKQKTSGYTRILRWSLKHRWAVIALSVLLLVSSLVLIPVLGTEFLKIPDEGILSISLTPPNGSNQEALEGTLTEIERVVKEHLKVKMIVTSTGSSNTDATALLTMGENQNSVIVHLADSKYSTAEAIEMIRQPVMEVAGEGAKVVFNNESQISSLLGGQISTLSINLSGPDYTRLAELSQEVITALEQIEGLSDLETNMQNIRPEVQIRVDQAKALIHGLVPAVIGTNVAEAVQGQVVTRLNVGEESLNVRVRLAEQAGNLDSVGSLSFNSALGQSVPLSLMANIQQASGPISITRKDQQPTVEVTGLITGRDLGSVSLETMRVINDLNLPTGYEASLGLSSELMQESIDHLSWALVLSVILIYMIMASLFEGLLTPFVIMFTLPLAAIGALWGLFITSDTINMLSMIGMIILVGIVVNNAIVLVDYINQKRRMGLSINEAVVEAGQTRLRPILMTSLTTILGLIPLAIGWGEGVEMISPLAVALIGGLVTSTLLTLVVIPVVYTFFHREKPLETQQVSKG
jgi:HAE1 family hydrophobic/amphiphilic exporter-1